MAELYQDKSEEKIKNDVSEQFKKDDGITRDDYEIYGAAIKVINSYIKEIWDSKKESRWPRAIKEFTDLQSQLSKEKNNMTGRKFLTENQKVIQDIANRIDNAEKLVLEKLVLNRANAKTINAINSSEKIQNKKYFNRDWSWILTFSSEVNKPTINEVLWNVFKNNTDVYKIDYSWCTNQNIKNKMASLSGWRNLFYISYDQEKKTYLLTDSSWNKLDQRALIREWVKLTPWWVIAYQAKQESKKSIEEKNKKIDEQSNIANKTIDQLKVDPKRWAIINLIPPSLKSELEKDISVYKDFLSKTEKRLDEVIKDAKSKNRELHTEPISKVYGSWLMEVHMISWTAEKDVKLWNDESHLWNAKLYDILDWEESWYKSYLTSRIQHKRSEYDYLTKKENVVSTNKEVKKENLASVEEKTNAIYWIWLMWKLIDNLREEEGNTRSNNDDRKITDIIKYIRNAQYSIQTNENISKSDLNAISIKLKDLYNSYKNIDEKYFASLISWPKDKSIEAIRKIWEWLTTFDNTHTTFLRDEIVENDNLEIKESIYNNCFQKIWEMLAIPEWDWEMPANIKANIDALYLNSANPQSVLNFLKSKWMLPSFATLDDEKIKEWCDKIFNTIQNKNQIINNFNITAEDMKWSLQEEKINLESKDNKTSDDIARLNAILFLLDNPEDLQKQAKNQTKVMKDVTKYAWIDSEIKWAIWSRLIKQWWWVSWTNADIYNDSIGAWWWFERSDENVSKTSEILEQIAIEVAICIVAIAAWALTFWAWTAAIYWARAAMIAARVVSAASKWWKILKIMKLASRFANYKKYYKAGKAISKALEVSAKARKLEQIAQATNKITKIGKIINPFVYGTELWKWIQTLARWTALVLEWTTFHLSSTVLHNAVNGKMDLFEWTDPTGYMVLPDWTQMSNRKSYAQSIAFLWVLKAVWQPVQQLTKALLAKIMSQKATASMMWKAVQSMWSFTWEVWTLMWTEQVLSLTFDQKLSPLTWEWFIHTIGMVAWLRGYWYTKLKLMNYISNTKSKSLTLEGEKNGKKWDILVKENWDITFKENLPTTLKIEASHMKAWAKLEWFKAGDKIKYGEKEYELKNNEVKEYKSSKNKYLEAKDSKWNDVELMLLEWQVIEFVSRPTTWEVNNLPTTLKIEASHMKAWVKLEWFKTGDKIKYWEKEYELFDIEVKEYKSSKNKYLEVKDSNWNIVELQLLEWKLIEFVSRPTTWEVNNLPTRQEIKQEPIKTPKEQIQEIRDNPQMEDIIILNEKLDSPQNKNRLEKLVIDINNDPSIPKRINRESFILWSKGEKFNYENWKLLDKLETTSIRNWDVVVSRRWEKFEITVKDWKAFLINKSNIEKEVEFTESMINNYKIVKRYATWNETRWVWYYTTKTLDFLQWWPIVWLSIKYPRKFIKLWENTIKEFQSFFRESTNPDIIKINEYNYIFRKETLWNNPQNIIKLKQNLKAWAKTVLNVSTPSSPEFSSMNRRTLKDIRRTGVKDGDLIVDKNWNEFVSEIRWKDVVLKDITLDKLWNESIMRIWDIGDYRVVRREWARNLWYINGRIVDNIANNVPLAKYPIWATRWTKNVSNKLFWKNKFKENKQENEPNQQPENQANNQDNINETNKQINYLENQFIEMQKQFDSKKNKSPDDIKTFEQNMDAYNQKIEVLKAEAKLKKEAEEKLKKEAEEKLKKEAEAKLKQEAEAWANIDQAQLKILEKPLKQNFSAQEWIQFRDALVSNIQTKYPKWHQEVLALWYRFEPLKNSSDWGGCDRNTKIITINPCKTIAAPGSKAKGSDIPIESMLHEMSHAITENNLALGLLAEARITDGNYNRFLNSANKEQQLFIKLANIYETKSKTFSEHAMYSDYTQWKNEHGVDLGKILPVREDMVELNAKYQRGELETYLNKRGKEIWVSQAEINSILQGFKDINGTKINKNEAKLKKEAEAKLKKEAEEKLKKEAEEKQKKEAEEKLKNSAEKKIKPKNWETIEDLKERAMKSIWDNEALMIKNWEVFIVNKNIDSPLSIEIIFKNNITELWPRINGKLDGDNCKRTEIKNWTQTTIESWKFKEWKLREWNLTSPIWLTKEFKLWIEMLRLNDLWMTRRINNETVGVEYWNEPININLSADHSIQVVRIKDYPELVKKYNINSNVDYLIVDWNLFRSTNGDKWFKALRNREIVTLWRDKNDRFMSFDNDIHISREHITITRDWNTIKLQDHSSNGSRVSRDLLSRSYTESKNANQNQRTAIQEYWKTLDPEQQGRLNSVMQKYPNVSISYLKNKAFVDFVFNWLKNISVVPRFNFSKKCPFPEEVSGIGYVNNPELTTMSPDMINVLSYSFTYKNTNQHYCTAAIPTFLKSMLWWSGIRFVDGWWNIYYTKMDADVRTSIHINWNPPWFWWVSDLAYKVWRFVFEQNSLWVSPENINNMLRQKWIEFQVSKRENNMLEIRSRDRIWFEQVGSNSNIYSYWGADGVRWDLYKKFSELITNINSINLQWLDANWLIPFFKKLQKVAESPQFWWWRSQFGLNRESSFNIDNIDYNYMIRTLENPRKLGFIRELLRTNTQSSNVDKLYMIIQQFQGLKSQAASRVAA